MKFAYRSAALAAALVAVAQPASAAGIKALILGDFNQSTDDAIRADLLTGDARFDLAASASYDLSAGMPSQAYLANFDSVLVFTDRNSADPTTLSNGLADYVDAGGGVVITTFWGQEVNFAGRLNTAGYNPLMSPISSAYQSVALGAYNAADPLMQGVSTLASSTFNADYAAGLDAGATLAASWDNGRPLAAYNAAHNVANITLYPNVVTFGHATGDYRRLFANALAFTGGEAVAPVPEPATWAMMIGGFALAGATARRRVRTTVSFA